MFPTSQFVASEAASCLNLTLLAHFCMCSLSLAVHCICFSHSRLLSPICLVCVALCLSREKKRSLFFFTFCKKKKKKRKVNNTSSCPWKRQCSVSARCVSVELLNKNFMLWYCNRELNLLAAQSTWELQLISVSFV